MKKYAFCDYDAEKSKKSNSPKSNKSVKNTAEPTSENVKKINQKN